MPCRPKPWLAASCLLLATLGCATEPENPPLRVYAAASLTDVVGALVEGYEADHDAPVSASFGGSSALARQIRDGAPADVFLSASPEWIEYLYEAGIVGGEPIVVARNRLVAIAPAGPGLPVAEDAGPTKFIDYLRTADGIAIADAGVPAGEYARAALESLHLLDLLTPKFVGQRDVRAVLWAVEQGELPVGFVYSTDAATAEVTVLFRFGPDSHPPIVYQAVALRDATDPAAARAFLAYLQSEKAKVILESGGFDSRRLLE